MKDGIEGDSFINLQEGHYFNRNFIGKTYFGERAIYEISPEEYEEFVDMYALMQSTSNPLVRELPDYIRWKFGELDDETIEDYSKEILFSSVALLKNFPCIDIEEGEVLRKAIEVEKTKATDSPKREDNEEYIELCKNAIGIFSKGNWPGSEIALESFYEFQNVLIGQNREIEPPKKNAKTELLLDKLQEAVGELEIRFGEVAATAFAFNQEHENSIEEKE